MGPIGMGEVIVLFVLALLIFGPKKLPELGKTFGKGMAEFKRASTELKTTFQREMDNIESETKDVKSLASDVRQDINTSYYDDNEDDYYSDYDYGGAASTPSSTGSAESSTQDGTGEAPASAQQDSSSNGSSDASPSAEATADGEVQSSDNGGGQPVTGVPEAEDIAASKPA